MYSFFIFQGKNQIYNSLIQQLYSTNKNKLDKPDLISSHGHTVFHEPKFNKTLQIGNGEIINKITGVKTVNNFREKDVKLGGQGAPLVPIGDKLLFNDYKYCLNLGGFINISVKDSSKIFAYDICPLNTVLNHYANKLGYECDLGGKLSKKGVINIDLFNELNDLFTIANLHHLVDQRPCS